MKFGELDSSSSKPLYQQISEIILENIKGNNLTVGHKLPPQRELCKIFNVSNDTMQEALTTLAKQGYVSGRTKNGTVIISLKPDRKINLKRENEICLVVCPAKSNDISNEISISYFAQRVIKGVEKKVREKSLFLLYTALEESELSLKEENVAGLIITGDITSRYLKLINKTKIPYVLIGDVDEQTKTDEGVDVIANDDFNGTYLAAKHLIDSGHKRIVYMDIATGKYSWEIEYFRGFQHAHKEAKVDYDKNLVIETGANSEMDAYIAIKKLLDQSISFTGLICLRETFLPGITKALEERSLKIPQDISLVNNGVNPDYTLITVDFEQMGIIAVERLIERLTKPDEWKPERIVVPYKLIQGNSTRKLEEQNMT